MTRAISGLLLFALGAGFTAVACDDKKSSSDAPRPDASTAADKNLSADPKLSKAIQAAASASAANENTPPPDGIFAAGAADQRHAKGVPTKVDMVKDGADPKVSFAPAADASPDSARASSYGPAALELQMSMGPRMAMPTIDFGMVLGPAKADEGGPDWLVGDVKRATPSKEQLGQLPPGTDKEIGSLAGSQIRLKMTADGRESDLLLQLGKASRPELERLAQNAAEALVFATVPLPPKPVGVGAQWIAETRMPLSGLDVIAYRAYTVKSVEGDRLHLTLLVKCYAASKDVQLQGVPKGATLEQFDAESKGEMEVVRGESLARKSDVQQQVVMVFAGPGGAQPPQQAGQPPGNMLTAQLQSQATLVRGEDLRAAMKQP
ncbi:MAG TPA: hypothetical protein VIF15_04070 [Polyangiaceae bacterium]|jgi:hypothetical protein